MGFYSVTRQRQRSNANIEREFMFEWQNHDDCQHSFYKGFYKCT